MKLSHFETIRPVCPGCRTDEAAHPLDLRAALRASPTEVREGVLVCPNPACQREYPILDGIPIILPTARDYVSRNLPSLLARDDLSPVMESLLGDCAGPGSHFDTTRQHLSSYGWGQWGDLDPDEPGESGFRGLVQRGADLAGEIPDGPIFDLGCGTGRSSFLLAERFDRPVLGLDLHFPMLQIAHRALATRVVRYPLRRVGLVYDPKEFSVDLPGAHHVDFWACDAQSLPFPAKTAAFVNHLNVLDCLQAPYAHLHELARVLKPGGAVSMATPYDWSAGATPIEAWLGGHSQRGPGAGRSDAFVRSLLDGTHPSAVPGLKLEAEVPGMPWIVRLHDRGAMHYSAHLLLARAV